MCIEKPEVRQGIFRKNEECSMKKIFKYTLLLLIIYLVVQIFVYFLTKTYYKDMKNYDILVKSPKIEVTESKVAKNKGYINGNITNDTDKLIKNLCIKFDFYNEQGKFLGAEYRREEILAASETIKFNIKYEYKNVSEIRISVVKD